MTSKTIKVAIIEDDKLIRESISLYFNTLDNFLCHHICDSIEHFLNDYSNHDIPDVILSDIGLPGIDGIEGISKIKKICPNANIIMISVYEDEDRIFKALCAGAVGYMQKSSSFENLKQAVIDVQMGGAVMSPGIASKVVAYFLPKKHTGEVLTPKEQQVVNCLVEGMSYKLVANRLGTSIDTVRQHIKNIYRKLHVNSKSEVVSKFLKGELD